VHRDIKPADLHIGRLGLQDDFVKVLDFVLVKSIGTRDKPGETLATREGMTPGTRGLHATRDGDG
jgi:serine/threonine protein kinase